MEIPNHSGDLGIPNTSEVVRALRALTGGFAETVSVSRADEWRVVYAPDGEAYFEPVGPTEVREFDDRMQLDLYSWLSEAKGLDVWTHPVWPEREMFESLQRFGAIALNKSEDTQSLYRIGPEGRFVDSGGRDVAPETVLDLARTTSEGASLFVCAHDHLRALAHLRLALDLARSRATGTDHWREYIRRGRGPFAALQQGLDQPPGWGKIPHEDRELAKLQLWFLAGCLNGALTVLPLPSYPKLSLAFMPTSAAQRAAITLAATAGLLDLPFQEPGVFQCEYPRCSRWFFNDRLIVKGERRFCSIRCGKSFHAAIATRRRRAAEKQRSQSNAPK